MVHIKGMLETDGITPFRLGAFEYFHVVLSRPKDFGEHRHERGHLTLLYSGLLSDITPQGEITLPAGYVLFHPEGFIHSTRVPAARTELVIINVDHDMVRAFCPMYGNVARDVQLPFEAVRGVPDRIREELIHRDQAAPVILEALTMQVCALGSRTTMPNLCTPPAWLPGVMTFIHRNLASPLTVRAVAAHVGVSVSRLAHVFMRVMGRSVTAYIRECRVRAAASALRESTAPIGEVALACGFYDQAHLSRAFKALRSMTPLEYRRTHRVGANS